MINQNLPPDKYDFWKFMARFVLIWTGVAVLLYWFNSH